MTERRGLTLIEVLIAVTILASMVAVCAPVIARSLRLLQSEPAADLFKLSQTADAVMSDPVAFGIDDWQTVTSVSISTDDGLDVHTVQAEVLKPHSSATPHAWIRFTDEHGQSVHRWLYQPPDEVEEDR